MIGKQALIHRTYKYKRMTRDEKDDDIWDLKDDEYSLEFTFWFRVLRWKDFHKVLIKISLYIILYLYST